MGFFQFGSLFIFVGQKLTKMTKADIVKQLAQETGVEAVTVLAVVEGFMEEVRAAQIRKENVFLRGFGTFLIKHRKEKTARNITKNTTIKIPAHDIPAFKPSPAFQRLLEKKWLLQRPDSDDIFFSHAVFLSQKFDDILYGYFLAHDNIINKGYFI